MVAVAVAGASCHVQLVAFGMLVSLGCVVSSLH